MTWLLDQVGHPSLASNQDTDGGEVPGGLDGGQIVVFGRRDPPSGQVPARARTESLPLLVTKLHPPRIREQAVARDRLLVRLRAGADARLTLVAAPPGYGKTTVLGMWRELELPSRPVAWLTVDKDDDDPVVFWSYVLGAIRSVAPEFGASVPAGWWRGARLDELLPALVNELAELGDAALVLDDFHLLTDGAARRTVAWFIDNAPSTLQLVIATRSEPALPLSALRAHAELVELRAADLGFSVAEAEELVNDRLDLGIEREHVEGLVERTEGWPAGLYLAALSLQGVDDRRAFVTRFGGENRHVVDFLVDEVLDAHDPALQELMIRCSVLDRLCGRLCDALVERDGSAELLESLAQSNLFLVPLDDRYEWFRFHTLFAQLLRAELERREPGLAPALHRRAYAWHRDLGEPQSAIEHALSAGMFDEAGELLATTWARVAHAGRAAEVLDWLDRLPRDLLWSTPRLLVVYAWVNSLLGRFDEADQALDAVEQGGDLDCGSLPDGFGSLEGSIATLRAAVPRGNVGVELENACRAAELEGPDSPWRATISRALGVGHLFAGDLGEAERMLRESSEALSPADLWRVAASSLAFRSLLAGERSHPREQSLLADEAAALVYGRGLQDLDGEVLLALALARSAQGADEAVEQIEQGVELARAHCSPLLLALALTKLAGARRAVGDDDGAEQAITDARTIVSGCPDPGMLLERLLAAPPSSQRPRTAAGTGELSARELVVLRMLRGPLSERDIGRELYLSHNTIHSHVKSIYRKLEVSSRAAALERARERGFV